MPHDQASCKESAQNKSAQNKSAQNKSAMKPRQRPKTELVGGGIVGSGFDETI